MGNHISVLKYKYLMRNWLSLLLCKSVGESYLSGDQEVCVFCDSESLVRLSVLSGRWVREGLWPYHLLREQLNSLPISSTCFSSTPVSLFMCLWGEHRKIMHPYTKNHMGNQIIYVHFATHMMFLIVSTLNLFSVWLGVYHQTSKTGDLPAR